MLEKKINDYNKDVLESEDFTPNEEEEFSTTSLPPPPYNPELEDTQRSASMASTASAKANESDVTTHDFVKKDAAENATVEPEEEKSTKEAESRDEKPAASDDAPREATTDTKEDSDESERNAKVNMVMIAIMQWLLMVAMHTKRLAQEAGQKAGKFNEKHQLTAKASKSARRSASFVKHSSIRARDNVVEFGEKHQVCPKVKKATKTVGREVKKASKATTKATAEAVDNAKKFSERHQLGLKAKYTARMAGFQIKRASKATVRGVRGLVHVTESSFQERK